MEKKRKQVMTLLTVMFDRNHCNKLPTVEPTRFSKSGNVASKEGFKQSQLARASSSLWECRWGKARILDHCLKGGDGPL